MKIFPLILLATLGVMVTASSCKEKKADGTNPLLVEWDTKYGVPPFDKIKVSDYLPAYKEAMKQHNEEIAVIVENKEAPNFSNTILAFDNSGSLLNRTELVFWAIALADTTPELQAVEEEIGPMTSTHYDGIMLNDALFSRIKAVYDGRNAAGLDSLQMRLLEKTYRNFVRNGANLSSEAKKEFMEINSELSKLSFNFGKNLLAENAKFNMVLDETDVENLPSGVRSIARQAAKDAGHGDNKYLFDISVPSMIPFLSYSPKRELREKIYTAYVTKNDHDDELDNKQVVNKIIELRNRRAHLLGYNSHAEFILDNNMAKTPANVYGLLDEIWEPALKRAKEELAEMQEMKLAQTGSDDFSSWDWWYYAEQLRKNKYDLNQDALRPYFSLETVKQGIFELSNRLYGITFKPVVLPVYNNDVSAYEVFDVDGTMLGVLYMDFHPRAGRKSPGAWCGSFRTQSYQDGKRVMPIVYIVANFTSPTKSTPALLDLDETKTFFHEFGHALHSLFSDVPYNGLRGVERDFVELPSQIMENWATEPDVLRSYAIHYQSNKVIPESLIRSIQNSKAFNQGFEATELLASAYADMDIHNMKDYNQIDLGNYTHNILTEARGLIPQIEPRYNYTYFSHIFNGGYDAGYYGYMWAEVLDKDAYQAFVETGDIFDKKTAVRFRNEILSKGGTQDGMVLYRNFRGSEPNRLPLLRARRLVEMPEPTEPDVKPVY